MGAPGEGRAQQDYSGQAEGGLQSSVWKVIHYVTNKNPRVNWVSHTHTCKPTFAPPCTGGRAHEQVGVPPSRAKAAGLVLVVPEEGPSADEGPSLSRDRGHGMSADGTQGCPFRRASQPRRTFCRPAGPPPGVGRASS